MRVYIPRSIVLLVALLLCSVCWADKLEEQVKAFDAFTERVVSEDSNVLVADDKIASYFHSTFHRYFEKSELTALTPSELEWLFNVTETVLFYVQDSRALHYQQALIEELAKRNVANRRHFSSLHSSLVHLRMFSEAQQLTLNRGELSLPEVPDPLPLTSDNTRFSYWKPLFSEKRLVQLQAEPGQGDAVVIIAFHPQCHFSSRAISDLSGSDELRELGFIENSLGIIPPDGRIIERDSIPGHLHNSGMKWGYANSEQDWYPVMLTEVPGFFFFDAQGNLVGSKTGWLLDASRKEEQISTVLRLVRRTDLGDPQ